MLQNIIDCPRVVDGLICLVHFGVFFLPYGLSLLIGNTGHAKLLLRTIELATYSLLSPLHLKVNVVPYIDKYALEGWKHAGCIQISCLF